MKNIESLDIVSRTFDNLSDEKIRDLAEKQLSREFASCVRRNSAPDEACQLIAHKAQSHMTTELAQAFAAELYERHDIDARKPRYGRAPKRTMDDFIAHLVDEPRNAYKRV